MVSDKVHPVKNVSPHFFIKCICIREEKHFLLSVGLRGISQIMQHHLGLTILSPIMEINLHTCAQKACNKMATYPAPSLKYWSPWSFGRPHSGYQWCSIFISNYNRPLLINLIFG